MRGEYKIGNLPTLAKPIRDTQVSAKVPCGQFPPLHDAEIEEGGSVADEKNAANNDEEQGKEPIILEESDRPPC